MRYLIFSLLFLFSHIVIAAFPAGGIIYNSTTTANQKIALGILPEGHMGVGGSLDIARNASYTGIAYNFGGSTGWKDATTPGCLCEGWGAGAKDKRGVEAHGEADEAIGGVRNLEVKSFIVDETSLESIVWIKDTLGNPILEVKHLFGPAVLRPDELFEAVVTMTNISGSTLTNVRYNRTMDWDIPPTEFSEIVTIVGAAASAGSSSKPKVYKSGNNGFRNPNVFGRSYTRSMSENQDKERYGPRDHGFTATFDFEDLICGEAHTFKIYYGAAATRSLMESALVEEEASIYSLGEPNNGRTTSTVTYGFGFKGVSGTALAPTLPEKIAILPGGVETDETKVQTYASPVIANEYAYQAIFKFRKDHQWEGDILRYALDGDGNFKDTGEFPPASAAAKLEGRGMNVSAHVDRPVGVFTSDEVIQRVTGRNVWTVGYDPNCPGDSTPLRRETGTITKTGGSEQTVSDQNNFQTSSSSFSATNNLDELIYNCGSETASGDTNKLIKFVRGEDSYGEDPGAVRQSLLGDTFHSDLVFVGPPVASLSSANSKTEAYFRSANGYAAFKETHKSREDRLYVGANDGMLHAYDKDLNELWAFIPPSVLPKLRGLVGESGKTNTKWLVDGPIIIKDVYINATSEWKTLLVGGLGWGGTGYFVLDITDEWDPQHLFSIDNDVKNKQVSYYSASGYKTTHDYASVPDNLDYSGLGKTWARPSIILLPYSAGLSEQRYVMAFGAGYAGGTATGVGNFVYVLDFEPSSTNFSDPVTGTSMPTSNGGNVIKKIVVSPDSTSDIPNGVTANMSVVTADMAANADFWGGIAYFPDLTGQMWKLDMSKTSLIELNSSMWTLSKAFKAQGTLANDRFGYNQMATTLVNSTDPIGTHLFNYYGTGDQAHIQRRDVTIKNRIFGVKDLDFPGTNLAITGESKTISGDGVFNVGEAACSSTDVPAWYSDVSALTTLKDSTGDFTKVIGRALVASGDVYFTLYRPENLACPIGGTGEVIKMADGCSGTVTSIATGDGLSTAPIMDRDGNIYVGVSNLATAGELDIDSSDSDKRSGVDNILKIGKADIESSDSATGINIESWRELRR